tara:strand:- start:668 stop:904 length:237 start_codon:yes stop_codon:yes gene_type:complete
MKANDLITANITLSRTQWALLEVALERETAISSNFCHPVFREIRDKVEKELELLYEIEIAKTCFDDVEIIKEDKNETN